MAEHQFHPTIAVDRLADGKPVVVRVKGREILLLSHDGQIFAFENKCSHTDEPLECGVIRHGWIACPAHGARFDLVTGEPLNPPAVDPITIYQTRTIDGVIELAI